MDEAQVKIDIQQLIATMNREKYFDASYPNTNDIESQKIETNPHNQLQSENTIMQTSNEKSEENDPSDDDMIGTNPEITEEIDASVDEINETIPVNQDTATTENVGAMIESKTQTIGKSRKKKGHAYQSPEQNCPDDFIETIKLFDNSDEESYVIFNKGGSKELEQNLKLFKNQSVLSLSIRWWESSIITLQIGGPNQCIVIWNNQFNRSLLKFLTKHTFVVNTSGDIEKHLNDEFSEEFYVQFQRDFSIKFYNIKKTDKPLNYYSRKADGYKRKKLDLEWLSKKITRSPIVELAREVEAMYDAIPNFMSYIKENNIENEVRNFGEKQKYNVSGPQHNKLSIVFQPKPKIEAKDQHIDEPDEKEIKIDQAKEEVKIDVSALEIIDASMISHGIQSLCGTWQSGSTKYVEFFEGEFTRIKFITSDHPSLAKSLWSLKDRGSIALDLEWNPYKMDKISLFQFCTSKGCLIVKYTAPSKMLKTFIKVNKFIIKDASNDRKMLKKTFDGHVYCNLYDVAVEVLRRNRLSENFDTMLSLFCDKKPTDHFKNKNISLSMWDGPISVPMMLYAAFDVVGLYNCKPNFHKAAEISQETNLSHRSVKNANKFKEYLP